MNEAFNAATDVKPCFDTSGRMPGEGAKFAPELTRQANLLWFATLSPLFCSIIFFLHAVNFGVTWFSIRAFFLSLVLGSLVAVTARFYRRRKVVAIQGIVLRQQQRERSAKALEEHRFKKETTTHPFNDTGS